MKMLIEIRMDNDAFGDCGRSQSVETARILAEISKKIGANYSRLNGYEDRLRDINGNACGTVRVEA